MLLYKEISSRVINDPGCVCNNIFMNPPRGQVCKYSHLSLNYIHINTNDLTDYLFLSFNICSKFAIMNELCLHHDTKEKSERKNKLFKTYH